MKFQSLFFLSLVLKVLCWDVKSTSGNWGGILDVGRSIAGIISSGIADFNNIRQKISFPVQSIGPRNYDHVEHDIISTDDLFSELSSVWKAKELPTQPGFYKNNSVTQVLPVERKPVNKSQGNGGYNGENGSTNGNNKNIVNGNTRNDINNIKNEDKNIASENIDSKIGANNINNKVKSNRNGENNLKNKVPVVTSETPNSGAEEEKEDEHNHWMRINVIVENLKSIFRETYGEDTTEKLELIKMLDNMIDIGNKINMVKRIENSFDDGLLEFLRNKWSNVQDKVIKSNPLMKTMLTVDGKVLLLTIAKGLVKQFGNLLHKQALAHLSEQDFVINTMRVSGFKDDEIFEVFNLLDLPTKSLVNTSRTLKPEDQGRGFFDFGDMFGRSGYGNDHKGGGYGYGQMMKKDPLVLLAGLAFATFAAYLVYKLISSTPAAVKRSNPDSSLSLTLSDMPEAMTNFYHWLEQTEKLYGDENQMMDEAQEEEGFINSMNELWKSFQIDTLSKSCMKRYLCYHIESNPFRVIRDGINLEQLALLTLAESLGGKGVSKGFDSHVTRLLEGETVDCAAETPSCDAMQFDAVVNKRAHIDNRRHE